jgi:hypothetical protein
MKTVCIRLEGGESGGAVRTQFAGVDGFLDFSFHKGL